MNDLITKQSALDALDQSINILDAKDRIKALSGRLSDRDRIIQLIEGHKGCQTQVNLILSRIIKEIQDYPFTDDNELHG